MSKSTINNGDTGLAARTHINANFTELYGGDPVNVKLNGAVGDGVADDTAAIQAIIDAAGSHPGGFVGGGIDMYFPPGRYLISSTLTIVNNVRMVGAGSDGGTVIALADGSNCDMMQIGLANSSEPVTVHLEGFRMVMDWTEQTSGFANIRLINYIRHAHFNDLFLYGATSYNLVMEQQNAHSVGRNNYFYGCAFEKGYNGGCNITHDYNLNFLNCYWGFGNDNSVAYIGLNISMTAQNLKINHCWFLGDIFYNNINLVGTCTYFQITDNTFNSDDIALAGSSHIAIGSNCQYGTITNNVFRTDVNYDYCVRLNSATDIVVTNNIWRGFDVSPILSSDTSSQYITNNYDAQNDKFADRHGSGAILNGNTTLVVTHNCYAAPASVIVTPNKNESVWVTDITSTQFTLNRAASSGDLICYYDVRI